MLTKIIDEYQTLTAELDSYIKASGVKHKRIYEHLKIDRTSYAKKRKQQTFTPEQIRQILLLIGANKKLLDA